MDNIDEVIDLKHPTDTVFNNESISTEHVKQENNISEDNIKESSDNKFELSKKVQKKVHKCAICGYQTPHSSRFFRHKNIHLTREERQLFPCTQCDNKYSTTQSLKYHLRNKHIDSRAKELNKSQKKIYKCSTCSYQARDMSVLRRHKAVHLAPEERQWFACTHCEKKYILKINLEHHIEDNHNDSRSEDALQNFHKCSICGYQTRLMSSFERHQKTHLAREEREMFPCSYCDKKYVSKGSLESHLGNNHIDSRSEDAQKTILRCSICGYQTIRSTRFEKHQKIHLAPVDREMFTCAHCDKPYISKQGLKHHIEDNHIDSRKKKSQGKVYKCAICDYETLCRSNLERHNNVHLAPEERQMFPCVHCGKKYARKQSLEHHLEDNHVDSRSKEARKNMQKCSICGYQTRNMIHFGQHQQIHLAPEERQMFACAYCDKKYTRKYKLKCHLGDNHIESSYKTIKPKKINHKKKESKKKFYKCAICDFQTLHSPNLTRHKKVHLPPEEREMFACIQCNTNYRSKMGLQRHLKRGHVDSRNAEFPEKSPTDEVILDSLKIELDDHALLLDDSKNSECLPVSNEVKSEDFLKTEPEYVALSLNRDMHDDFSVSSHADCISVTDKVILDPVKIETDDPLLDDSKNSDCISVTNEVKSEPEDVALFLDRDMRDNFKNNENLSDFIKTEPEDDALILDRHAR